MTTKEKILKSALTLFAKQWIDKTSTIQITKDVWIASWTLFVHFKTKQELIDNIYIQIKSQSSLLFEKYFDLNKNLETNIKIISWKYIEYFIENYDEFLFLEMVEKGPLISDVAIELWEKEYEDSLQYLQKWIQDGIIKNIDLRLIHDLTWNWVGTIIKYCKKHEIENIEEKFLDLVWDIIKK